MTEVMDSASKATQIFMRCILRLLKYNLLVHNFYKYLWTKINGKTLEITKMFLVCNHQLGGHHILLIGVVQKFQPDMILYFSQFYTNSNR